MPIHVTTAPQKTCTIFISVVEGLRAVRRVSEPHALRLRAQASSQGRSVGPTNCEITRWENVAEVASDV